MQKYIAYVYNARLKKKKKIIRDAKTTTRFYVKVSIKNANGYITRNPNHKKVKIVSAKKANSVEEA